MNDETQDALLGALSSALKVSVTRLHSLMDRSHRPEIAKDALVELAQLATEPNALANDDEFAIRQDAREATPYASAFEFWTTVPVGTSLLPAALASTPDEDHHERLADILGRGPNDDEITAWLDEYRKILFSRAPSEPRERCVCGRVVETGIRCVCAVCGDLRCAWCCKPCSIKHGGPPVCSKCRDKIPTSWVRATGHDHQVGHSDCIDLRTGALIS